MRHAWSKADEDEQRKQWGAERQHAHGAVATEDSCGEESGLGSSSRTLLRRLLQPGLGRGGWDCTAHGGAPVGDKQ
jgi:hypothetical protein